MFPILSVSNISQVEHEEAPKTDELWAGTGWVRVRTFRSSGPLWG